MTFQLDDDQWGKVLAWLAEQDAVVAERQRAAGMNDRFASLPYYGASGGVLTFSFTPTTLGTIARVKHGVTGAEADVTDYENW